MRGFRCNVIYTRCIKVECDSIICIEISSTWVNLFIPFTLLWSNDTTVLLLADTRKDQFNIKFVTVTPFLNIM